MEKIRLSRGGKDGEPSKVVFRCVREVADVCRSDDAALGPVKGHRNQGREQMHPERPEALARGAPESEQTEEAKAAFGALEKRRPEH